MCGSMLLVAAIAVGIDAGWQIHPDGGMEYIIQIEPEMLESLRAGDEVASDIPSYLGDIRGYRIRVGSGDLPHENPPPAPAKTFKFPDVASSPPPTNWPIDPLPTPTAPQHLPTNPGTRPLPEKPAVFNDEPTAPPEPGPTAPEFEPPTAQEPSKPWLPLTLSLAALFATTGGMLYFAWIAWDYRSRYRGLLERVLDTPEGQTPAIDAVG